MNWKTKPNVQTFNTISRQWDLREFDTSVGAHAEYVRLHKLGLKVKLFDGSVSYREPRK